MKKTEPTQPLRCLIIEDAEADAQLMLRHLREGGYDVQWERLETAEAMRAALACQPWDLILSDYKLPRFSGSAALELLHASGLDLPFIVVSGTIGEETAVEMMRAGAHDYFMKGKLVRLVPAIERELRDANARRERRQADEELRRFFNLIPELVCIASTSGKFVKINPAWQATLGYSETEILAIPFLELVHPDDRDATMQEVARQLAGGATINFINRYRHKDGSYRWLEWKATPAVDETLLFASARDITERKQAEASLRLHTTALTAAANAIVITDCDGTIVWTNPAFTTLTGYSCADAVGKNPRDLIRSGQVERSVYEQLWQTIIRGKVWRGELINRRKDGSLYPEEQTITPLIDAGGKITHFIAIKLDLTERRQAEAALRTSEEQHRSITDTAHDAIITADAAGRIIDWNPGAERTFGYQEGEVCGEPLAMIIPTRFREPHRAGMERLLAGGEPHVLGKTMEMAGLHRDGREFPLEISLSRWESTQGVFFTAIIRDITERKQAEAQLRQSEERYRLLFDSNPLPMFIEDVDSLRFLAVNEAAVHHYGYTREEFLGLTVQQLCNPEDVALLLNRITQDRLAVESSGELRHRRKDGTTIQVETFSRPLTFDGRNARLVLANDITEKKLMEEKFLHAQRLESIGMLASGIAHDLNNVLAPIMFAAPMLRGSLTTPRDVKILDTLEKSATRCAGLVKQILGFAHSTTGEFQPIQVKHLARDIVSLIEETFPKSIQLEHQVPSNLWPVQGNATQIHQVLLNLCVNARDAMPQGGTLRLTAANRRLEAAEIAAHPGARPGAWLMLEVADTGTGIPPEVLERIWTPFFTTKELGKGTGLGLSTVRGIVLSHHGFVEMQSEVGHGSAFRVFLPALAVESAKPDSATPFVPPDGRGQLILVAEDEPRVSEIVAVILGQHGYRVECCADGLDALIFFNAHASEISVVITDVDMPRLNGVGLARAVLQMRPDIRLIAISGLSRNEKGGSDVPAIRALVHEFLSKPFTAVDLLAALDRVLRPPPKPEPPCPASS